MAGGLQEFDGTGHETFEERLEEVRWVLLSISSPHLSACLRWGGSINPSLGRGGSQFL